MALTLEREIIKKKAQEVAELTKMIDNYSVIGIADLYKVRAIQLQELTRRFGSTVQKRVVKKNIVKMAVKNSKKKGIEKLIEHLQGSNIILFTNMNTFNLILLLERSKIKMTAKTGDIAQDDIVVPAGNTALPPGPVISELNDVGVRTRIEGGSVWAIKETVIVKKGEVVTSKVASILPKLGIKSLEVGLKIIAAYDDGLVLSSKQLVLNLDETRGQIKDGFNQAFNISLNILYPTNENICIILWRAGSNARNLAMNSTYFTPEVTSQLIAKAYGNMSRISLMLQ